MSKRERDHPGDLLPSSRQAFKKSKYILESMLTPYMFVPHGVEPIGIFEGDDQIYLRSKVKELRSRHSWRHKYMRAILSNEKPTRVISRQVGGVSRSVELFSLEQTEPLQNLIASEEAGIPVNEYGNVDSDFIPQNAVLIETKDINLAIRELKRQPDLVWCRCQNGWKRKQPNFVGIVVLASDEDSVRAMISSAEEALFAKDLEARTDAAMAVWRVLIQRMKAEYYIQTVIDK